MYRSNHLLDPQKKNMSALIELTQLLKRKQRSTQPTLLSSQSPLNRFDPIPVQICTLTGPGSYSDRKKTKSSYCPHLLNRQLSVSPSPSLGGTVRNILMLKIHVYLMYIRQLQTAVVFFFSCNSFSRHNWLHGRSDVTTAVWFNEDTHYWVLNTLSLAKRFVGSLCSSQAQIRLPTNMYKNWTEVFSE